MIVCSFSGMIFGVQSHRGGNGRPSRRDSPTATMNSTFITRKPAGGGDRTASELFGSAAIDAAARILGVKGQESP